MNPAACAAQCVVPRLDEQGVSLLAQLLAFNPAQRVSARRALQHPYFADLRAAEAAARSGATAACAGAADALVTAMPPDATNPTRASRRVVCKGNSMPANGQGHAAARGAATEHLYSSGDVEMAAVPPSASPGAPEPDAGAWARVAGPPNQATGGMPSQAPGSLRGHPAAPLSLLCTEVPECAAGLGPSRSVCNGGAGGHGVSQFTGVGCGVSSTAACEGNGACGSAQPYPVQPYPGLNLGQVVRAGSCGQLRGGPPRRPLATLSAPAAAQRANEGAGLGAAAGACHRLDLALQSRGLGCASMPFLVCLIICRVQRQGPSCSLRGLVNDFARDATHFIFC